MKNKIKNLCIISSSYPSRNNPVYTFVDQLLCQFADNNINLIVISPSSVSKRIVRKINDGPKESIKKTKKGNIIRIYRPNYISFSYSLINLNTAQITYNNFKRCVIKEMKNKNLLPDVIYGHFIAPSGMCAADIGDLFKIPSFLSNGESSIKQFSMFKRSFIKKKLSKLSGVISVSNKNKNDLLDLKLINDPNSIVVLPNGIDTEKFYKIDRKKARKILDIPERFFIVVFVGSFIERKGIGIMNEVLKNLDNIHSIFIGKGPIDPNTDNILYKGMIPHEDLYLYLNASDVFVLPTLAEGCCNAIIEAMACGLPIISSDQSFNDDILNKENSIRINVKNLQSIREAILYLRDNTEIRNRMSQSALISASNLNIKQRAKNIISFMESRI